MEIPFPVFIIIALFSLIIFAPKLVWSIRHPFLLINWLQWFFMTPLRSLIRNHRADWPRVLFFLLSPVIVIYWFLAYVVLIPLRLINAIYFDFLLFWSVAFNGSLTQFISRFFPVMFQSMGMLCVDLIWPTLTLFHGTPYESVAVNITHEGRWKVGNGNYAGTGIYFSIQQKVAEHYARSLKQELPNSVWAPRLVGQPAVIVTRVTLAPCRLVATLPKPLRQKVGIDGNAISRGVSFPWVSLEHWRDDQHWYEFCLLQPAIGTDVRTWRVRPICVVQNNKLITAQSSPPLWLGSFSPLGILFVGLVLTMFILAPFKSFFVDTSVEKEFSEYWNEHGGVFGLGHPISGVLDEISDIDGKSYKVQYFERSELEFHLNNPLPYRIQISQLGTLRFGEKYLKNPPRQTVNQTNGHYFQQTKHWVGGKFWQYWNQHNGLTQLGYPISDEFNEVSHLNNKSYTVQYFERSVLELHPENKPPHDVQLSLLGAMKYKQLYGNYIILDYPRSDSSINTNSETSSQSTASTPRGSAQQNTTPQAASPTQRVSNLPTLVGTIEFDSFRDDNKDIYTVNPDGSNLRRLTNDVAQDSNPTWAPDGKQIAFISDRPGSSKLFIMHSDGTDIRSVPCKYHSLSQITWSPNGKYFAFIATPAFENSDISWSQLFIMNIDGTNMRRLINRKGDVSDPSWSPDSKRIAISTIDSANDSKNIWFFEE